MSKEKGPGPKRPPSYTDATDQVWRWCTRHQGYEKLEKFGYRKSARDGRHPHCRRCVAEQDKLKHQSNLEANRAKLRDRKRAERARDREKAKEERRAQRRTQRARQRQS